MSGPLVVVTLGTDHHGFDRLVSWVERWLAFEEAKGVDCLVQHGSSRPPNGARCVDLLPRAALLESMSRAVAVVCQGGPGSIMDSRESGHVPIVVPRRASLREHVDDHQVAFTRRLHAEGTIILVESEQDFVNELAQAMQGARPRIRRGPDVGQVGQTVSRFEALVTDLVKQPRHRPWKPRGGRPITTPDC